MAQEQLDMAKTLTSMYSSGLIATCRADAAALLTGAQALERSEELRAVVRDFQRMYCGFGMKTEAEALNDRATAARLREMAEDHAAILEDLYSDICAEASAVEQDTQEPVSWHAVAQMVLDRASTIRQKAVGDE
jgi:hypothetical protein